MAAILVLSNMYPPHHLGGYELSCRDVVDRWRAHGHDVTVLTGTMRLPGVVDPPGERDAGVRRDLEIAFRDGDLFSYPLAQRAPIERANHRALTLALEEVRPDVVSIWHMGAMSTSLLTPLAASGVPLVYVVCDHWPTYAHKVDPWMRMFQRAPLRWPVVARRVERFAGVPARLPDVGRSGTFCFISADNRERCTIASPWSFPDSTISYNGFDHTDFPVAERFVDTPWSGRMVNAGRLDPRKGLATAVRALVHLPDATLELLPAADDPYRAELEKLAAELGVRERLQCTFTTRDRLRQHYLDADVCVFPTEWDEPFGLVPLEAMAGGTPVVATGRGGSGEFLLDEENCLRFPEGDPAALAAAVQRLASDPALRERLVTGGLRTAAALTVDRYAESLEEWHLAAAARFADGRPPDRVLSIR
jgi:glycosyltransferase involved in cell wall biosynthesis